MARTSKIRAQYEENNLGYNKFKDEGISELFKA